MEIEYEYITETGSVRDTNQDSLIYMAAEKGSKKLVLAAVADGMGGENAGEAGSRTAVDMLNEVFEQHVKKGKIDKKHLTRDIRGGVQLLNERLYRYGLTHGLRIGTTLSVLIIFPDSTYTTIHVGDTRIYRLHRNSMCQITTDMSYVESLIRRGEITRHQARFDPRRNVLLECIGITESVKVEIKRGRIKGNTEFIICSDGYWHELDEDEMRDRELMLREKVRRCMERGEDDNITAIYIRCRKGAR